MAKKDEVFVVILAKNEGRTIKDIIKSVRSYADKIIVVVSKNSIDHTEKIARSMRTEVIIDNGKGKGKHKRG